MFAGCGTTIRASSGTISTPNYPDTYNSGENCAWLITVPRGFVVLFTVLDINIGNYVDLCRSLLGSYEGYLAVSVAINK